MFIVIEIVSIAIAFFIGRAMYLSYITSWQEKQQEAQQELFQQSIEYMHGEDYESALVILNDLPHSEKPICYAYQYVRARIAYDPDNIDAIKSARNWMPSLTYLVDNNGEPELAHYDGVLASEIDAFQKELYERYDICKRREFEGTSPMLEWKNVILNIRTGVNHTVK